MSAQSAAGGKLDFKRRGQLDSLIDKWERGVISGTGRGEMLLSQNLRLIEQHFTLVCRGLDYLGRQQRCIKCCSNQVLT